MPDVVPTLETNYLDALEAKVSRLEFDAARLAGMLDAKADLVERIKGQLDEWLGSLSASGVALKPEYNKAKYESIKKVLATVKEIIDEEAAK